MVTILTIAQGQAAQNFLLELVRARPVPAQALRDQLNPAQAHPVLPNLIQTLSVHPVLQLLMDALCNPSDPHVFPLSQPKVYHLTEAGLLAV